MPQILKLRPKTIRPPTQVNRKEIDQADVGKMNLGHDHFPGMDVVNVTVGGHIRGVLFQKIIFA